MKILDGKFNVKIDSFYKVIAKGRDGGTLETQSVDTLLLLEIVDLLQKQSIILDKIESPYYPISRG